MGIVISWIIHHIYFVRMCVNCVFITIIMLFWRNFFVEVLCYVKLKVMSSRVNLEVKLPWFLDFLTWSCSWNIKDKSVAMQYGKCFIFLGKEFILFHFIHSLYFKMLLGKVEIPICKIIFGTRLEKYNKNILLWRIQDLVHDI